MHFPQLEQVPFQGSGFHLSQVVQRQLYEISRNILVFCPARVGGWICHLAIVRIL